MNCRFVLLRYIPDVVKGEFINLGVTILDEAGGFLGARMSGEAEIRRLRCFHPEADLELIAGLGRAWSRGEMPWTELESWRETLSDSVRVTDTKVVTTGNWQQEMDALYRRYVAAPPREKTEQMASPRGELHQRLHNRLLIAGLLDRLQPFPVDRYTAPGDSFKIDYAYSPAGNGKRKYLHAVTIDRAMPQATRLAFAFERIRKASKGDQLTALFDEQATRESATPIRSLLESSGIAVRPYGEMDTLVKEIRRDLAA
jgi:hypothetical protein